METAVATSSHEKAEATAAAAPAPAPAVDYEPRRSNRVAADLALADGETWRERIAVCEGATPQGAPRLLARSYFRNKRTGQRVWDEPPSGASNIIFATAEDRKKADIHLSELRVTLDMIPPEEEESADGAGKKKKGFLSRFRGRKGKETPQINDAQDLNLQRAIARSMADQAGGSDDPVVFYDPDNNNNNQKRRSARTNDVDDEDLALAKALSMSGSPENNQMSEEEMIQLAIAESQREAEQSNAAAGVAAMPLSTTTGCPYDEITNELSNSLDLGSASRGMSPPSSAGDLDLKMPAAYTKEHPRINPTNSFDPYAHNDAEEKKTMEEEAGVV